MFRIQPEDVLALKDVLPLCGISISYHLASLRATFVFEFKLWVLGTVIRIRFILGLGVPAIKCEGGRGSSKRRF